MTVESKLSSLVQEQVREAIQSIAVGPDRGRDISQDHAEAIMHSILHGEVDEVQTAVFLIALRMKRESMGEFLGLYAAIAKAAESKVAQLDDVICLADPFDGYLRNATMTPFIPAVLAANGLNTVMHGVRTVGPKHGVTAHKVYQMAGANVTHSVNQATKHLERFGLCYIDQSQYAASLHDLQSLRDRIVKRTALTTLERMLMPIKGRKSTKLVLGYVHNAYPEIYGQVALAGGFDTVILLKGVEGGLAPALNKPLRRFVFDGRLPDDIGASKEVLDTPFTATAKSAAQPMQSNNEPVEQCLEQGLAVLKGQSSMARDSLTLACSHILNSQCKELSMLAAVEKVQSCLDNGSALERFNAFVDAPK